MTQYSDEDIRMMAEDILDGYFTYVDECRNYGYECNFCMEIHPDDPKEIKHDHNCAVLIAKRILGKDE